MRTHNSFAFETPQNLNCALNAITHQFTIHSDPHRKENWNWSIRQCSDQRLVCAQLYSCICWWLHIRFMWADKEGGSPAVSILRNHRRRQLDTNLGEIEAATVSESYSKPAWWNESRGVSRWTCFPSVWQKNPISWSMIAFYSNNFNNGTPRSTAKFPKHRNRDTYIC